MLLHEELRVRAAPPSDCPSSLRLTHGTGEPAPRRSRRLARPSGGAAALSRKRRDLLAAAAPARRLPARVLRCALRRMRAQEGTEAPGDSTVQGELAACALTAAEYLDLGGRVLSYTDVVAVVAALGTLPALRQINLRYAVLPPGALGSIAAAAAETGGLTRVPLAGAVVPAGERARLEEVCARNAELQQQESERREAAALDRLRRRKGAAFLADVTDLGTWESVERHAIAQEWGRAATKVMDVPSFDWPKQGRTHQQETLCVSEQQARSEMEARRSGRFLKIAAEGWRVRERAQRAVIEKEELSWRNEMSQSEANAAHLTRLGGRDRARRERVARGRVNHEETAMRRTILSDERSAYVLMLRLLQVRTRPRSAQSGGAPTVSTPPPTGSSPFDLQEPATPHEVQVPRRHSQAVRRGSVLAPRTPTRRTTLASLHPGSPAADDRASVTPRSASPRGRRSLSALQLPRSPCSSRAGSGAVSPVGRPAGLHPPVMLRRSSSANVCLPAERPPPSPRARVPTD
eukprot:TRINITY_DN18387_c0_g1_i1.p1 TRINITY_DN18387_c0_g1~~TRINITY_DN18387_c0_g1_i1.p1  ORF type:complete len:542 (+),score=141.82 TRINITY_DN18387_c0_g1_i1:67-1626(+)